MRRIVLNSLIGEQYKIQGALDFDPADMAIRPRRLPAWTRVQVPRLMDAVVRMPSGMRIMFETNSTSVELEVLTTDILIAPAKRKPAVFDLEFNDEIRSVESLVGHVLHVDPEDSSRFELQKGNITTISFFDLPAGNKRCELWLPQGSFVELHNLLIDEGAEISKMEELGGPRWLHYGSSISHCMEAEQPSQIWPAVAARQAGACLHNFGFAGECHLDQFVARSMAQTDADMISIKCGINIINGDTMRERVFASALHGFIDTIRQSKPTTPIVLISPIYCPSAETNVGPTVPGPNGKWTTIKGHSEIREGCMTLERVRTLIERIVEKRNDNNLGYLSGLELFSEADAQDLPDDLHPNSIGYIRMGERFASKCLNEMVVSLRST
ncbi:MAG: SGNH/GDSL hydrolase family protein [Pseudomonadales bacterium]|jgi:hypothetical protein